MISTYDTLNLKRLYQLIINDLRMHAKTILIVTLTLMMLSVLMPFYVTGSAGTYLFILYVGGIIITSLAFNDIHDRTKANLYLTLPCSNLERFLSKWFLTSIGFAIGVLIIYFIFSLVIAALNFFLFRHPLNIFQPILWSSIWKYILLQSIFLFGAIRFKRFSFIKTMFFICFVTFCLSVVAIGSLWLLFGYFDIQHNTMLIETHMPESLRYVIKFFFLSFWVILAATFWYFTYSRITNYELS